MKKTISFVLSLVMIIATLTALPFTARADEKMPVRWNGLKIEFIEQPGVTQYGYAIDVLNKDCSLFVQKPYVKINKVGNTYQAEDGKYKCNYNSETGVVTTWEVLQSKYVLANKYYRFCIFYSDKYAFSELVSGQELILGYKGGFWPIEGKATITGTPNVGNTLWANYNDESDPAVPSGKIKRTWQRSVAGANMWNDISGATGMSYTVTNADKNCDIRVKITAEDYSDYVVSQTVSIVKNTCTVAPVKPSCGWNGSDIVVTNAKKNQEYLVLGNEASAEEPLEDSFWNASQTPSANGSFELNHSGTSRINYVYTRVKATDTTLASTAWEVGTVFTGLSPVTKGLALTYENTSRSDSEPMQVGDVLRVSVSALPAGASDFEGVEGRAWTTNGGAVAYTSADCTTSCASTPYVKYSVVYLRLSSQKNNCALKAACTNSISEKCKGSLTFNIANSSGKYLLDDIIIPDMPVLMAGKTVKNVPFETVPANASLDNISFYNGGSNYKGPKITIDKTNQTLTFDLSKAEAGNYNKSLRRSSTELKSKSFTITENTTPVEDLFFNIDTFPMSPGTVWNTYFTVNVVPTGANYDEITLTSSNPSLVSVNKGSIVKESELYCTADINITGAAQGGETVFITATSANGKSDSFVVMFTGGEPQPTHTVHTSDEGTVTKTPTVYETGIKEYHCKECGLLLNTEILQKLSSETPKVNDNTAQQVEMLSPEQAVDIAITTANTDDPEGTEFSLIQAKASKVTNTSIKLAWKGNAKKYVIYGNKCGTKNNYKKLATTTKKSYTFKKIAGSKVKKGTYYKFIVVAFDKNNEVISVSKTVHTATTGGKVGNDKSVKTAAKKNTVALKKGKTFNLKAKAVPASNKLKVKRHRKMAYESSNTKIATVNSKGIIKAKKKGTCYVYAYTQNGVLAKIKVTVK